MKQHIKTFFHITMCLFFLFITSIVFITLCSLHSLSVTYESAVYSDSAATLDNPYCGFYQMRGYTLSDTNTPNAADWTKQQCKNTPYQLLLLEINLKNYSSTSLSSNALQQVDTILSTCKTGKKQLILRFLYDWDGKAQTTEPDNLSLVKDHMTQLSSLINTHKDCIYIIQGLFIGNYGEMNNSRFTAPTSVRELAEHLASVTDPSIYLSVRTPAQLRSILQSKNTLSDHDAYTGTLTSRLGLFNDGLLGSANDLGTYSDTPLTDTHDYEEKGTRQEEIQFQDLLCQYVPNGGEVTVNNPYNDIEHAVSDFSAMHISYLNAEYDPKVLQKWKNTTYQNLNGYQYMQQHIGYRYLVKQSTLQFHSFASDSAKLYLTIENDGFAPAYRKFDTTITVTDRTSAKSFVLETDIDNRLVAGSNSSIFCIDLNIRTWKSGTYDLSLNMTDPDTDLPIYFAHEGFETTSSIPIGTLTLE